MCCKEHIRMYDLTNPLLDDPLSLQEACIDYICDNLGTICSSVTAEDGEKRLQFKEEEVPPILVLFVVFLPP